ncbi:MAG: methionyl-tRNA formyltransferase, partial [Spirochaetaceae bacterium]|nr:methionyl-tRNA formyltransferase [Spirochaetaceae bacterium]
MLKIVYCGSPEIAALPLKELFEDKTHQIVAVLTNPPSMKGRKGDLVPTPVEMVAREFQAQGRNVEILTPEKLDSSVREKISSLNPDILVCFAYGKIFGPKFLELFPMGAINLHPSLLPKYRGCAPVPAAILNQDKITGITIQRLVQQMDAGDILLQKELVIQDDDNSETVLNKASSQGGKLFLEVLNQIENKTEKPVPQDESQATYCRMLEKEDGKIDWSKSANEIDAKIRAFYPWPGAFTKVGENILKIHSCSVFDMEKFETTNITVADCSVQKLSSISGKIPGTVLGVD